MRKEAPRSKQTDGLRESEIKYRGLYESTQDGIAMTDIKGNIVECNRAYSDMLGYSQEEIEGITYQQTTPVKWHAMERNIVINKILKTGYSDIYEKEYIRKDGTVFPVSLRVWAIKDEAGNITGMWGIVRDIAELKMAERAIKLNEARLESLLKISQYKSESVHELLDFALDEAVSLTVSKIGYIYFYDDVKKEFQLNTWSKDVMKECAIAEQQTIYQLEKTGIWGEGVRQSRPIMVNDFHAPNPLKKGYPEGHAQLHKYLTIPVFSDERIVAVVAVANKQTDYDERDVRQLTLLMDSVWKIVERKQTEIDLKERTQQLEYTNKELESFSYSVSHDLRAPLRAIDGYARLILKKQGDKFDADTLEKFNVIRSSTHLMGQLIDDLLTFSRLGRKEISLALLDMNILFKDAWKEVHAGDPERKIKPKVESMPPCYGDRALIKQVLINLLSNAVKFTKYKDATEIAVGGSAEGSEIVYFIRDNGIGFDMTYYDKLFGVFQRLHSTDQFEGTGVGLATVQRIIRRHGGRVWAEGKVDEGATFYFSLPLSHTHK